MLSICQADVDGRLASLQDVNLARACRDAAARDETAAPAVAVPGAVQRLQEVVGLDCDATLELLLVWSLHRTARTDERLRLVRSPAWPVDSSAAVRRPSRLT